jgi:hypothetical protein
MNQDAMELLEGDLWSSDELEGGNLKKPRILASDGFMKQSQDDFSLRLTSEADLRASSEILLQDQHLLDDPLFNGETIPTSFSFSEVLVFLKQQSRPMNLWRFHSYYLTFCHISSSVTRFFFLFQMAGFSLFYLFFFFLE